MCFYTTGLLSSQYYMYEKRVESPRRHPEYRGLVCQRPKYHKQSTEKYRKDRNTAMV